MIITKRILSQLYGRGDVSGLAAAQLERKLSLCRDLLHYVARVDGGFSQCFNLLKGGNFIFICRKRVKNLATEP